MSHDLTLADNETAPAITRLITPEGLSRLPKTQDEITELYGYLYTTNSALRFCRIDLGRAIKEQRWAKHQGAFTDETIAALEQLAKDFGISYGTLIWEMGTMTWWTYDKRLPGLTVEHYRAINRIPQHMPDIRLQVAADASEQGWTAKETEAVVFSQSDAPIKSKPAPPFQGARFRGITHNEKDMTIDTSQGNIIIRSESKLYVEYQGESND